MLDVKACLSEIEEMMEMTIMHLEEEYSHIRAGKANVHLLDCVRVSSYGSTMLRQSPPPTCVQSPSSLGTRI